MPQRHFYFALLFSSIKTHQTNSQSASSEVGQQLPIKCAFTDWSRLLSSFELSPNSDQLAFEGDVFSLQCRVTDSKSGIKLVWYKDGKLVKPSSSVTKEEDQVTIKSSNGFFDGNLLFTSSLTIQSLRARHTGRWLCQVISTHGNSTKSVNLLVIPDNANYCPQTKTVTNKGTYEWPVSLSGVTVELPCQTKSTVGLKSTHPVPVASYYCSIGGNWESLNTSNCLYISEVTKVLEQFSKTNLSLTLTNGGLDGVRGLRNYTADGSMLRDKMDIVYIARTIANYLEFVAKNKEVARVLIDVINTVMNVNPSLIEEAQLFDMSASKILKSVGSLSELLGESTLNKFNDNLAIEEFIVKSEDFPGMRCTSRFNDYDTLNVFWKRRKSDSKRNFQARPEKPLHCSLSTNEGTRKGKVVQTRNGLTSNINTGLLEEVSIRLPSSLFQEANASSKHDQKSNHFGKLSHKLQFSVFRSGVLFPTIEETKRTSSGWNQSDEYMLTSFVIGCRIAFTRIPILKNGIEVTLKASEYTEDTLPVWWDEDHQGWTSRGCSVIWKNPVTGGIKFKCHHLGHYSLMQRKSSLLFKSESTSKESGDASSFFGHYSLYIGAALSVPILLFVILIYSLSFSAIQMPRKTKHSLINTWLATGLLIGLFSLGIKQTSFPTVCKGIGLSLHYLILSSFLWMIMTSANMYKTISSHRRLAEDPDCEQIRVDVEELYELSPKPRPLVGHYLFGWGIALIIVGISSAISLDNYGGSSHCFINLTTNNPVIYAPFGTLVSILTLLHLLICCLLGGLGTDVVSPRISQLESISLKSGAPSKDKCWNLKKQLYLQFVYFCLLALILALMCLLTVINVLKLKVLTTIDNQVLVGSMISALSLILSLYVLVFFCFKRKDTLHLMYRMFFGLCLRDKKQVFQKGGDVIRTESVRNLDSVRTTNNDQSTECVNDFEQSHQKEMYNLLCKPTTGTESIDLLPKSNAPMDFTSIPAINEQTALNFPQLISSAQVSNEVFLNPRLNAIAKKYFEKNRRRQQLKMMEKNNANNMDNVQNRIFANDDYINEFGLRSPKRSNICPPHDENDEMKAKSEILPLTKYKSSKYCSSSPPSSHRQQRLKPCLSAKEVNTYKSSPNVKDIFYGSIPPPVAPSSASAVAFGAKQRVTSSGVGGGGGAGHHCKSSHSSSSHHHHHHHRKDHVVFKSSIPTALSNYPLSDVNEAVNMVDKDKSEVLSVVCCQSDILTSVSQPVCCSSRKSSRKNCNYCQRQQRRRHQRHKRHHCPECALNAQKKEERILENPGKEKLASGAPFDVVDTSSNPGQRRRRRKRRTSNRSTERVKELGHHPSTRCEEPFLPRSRSAADKIADHSRDCRCRYKYCSSSD